MKEGVSYWSCTPQAGCYSIVVCCVVNARQRLMHNGFYALPRLRYDNESALQQRLMRLGAVQVLRHGVRLAILKELGA